MNNRYKKLSSIAVLILVIMVSGCDDFLDAKPNKALVTLNSLDDLQAVLDNSVNSMNISPSIPLLASDEFYTNEAGFSSLNFWQQNIFTWATPVFGESDIIIDWSGRYSQIFSANVVLEESLKLEVLSEEGLSQLRSIRSAAHFYRAYAYYDLLQVFGEGYNPYGDNSSLSVPLRKSPNAVQPVTRATLSESYQFVLDDLNEALKYLPDWTQPITRPSKAASYALLAKVYLLMGDFQKALEMSESSLQIRDNLLDYSTLNLNQLNPFGMFNEEILFYSEMPFLSFFSGQLSMVNLEFFNRYDEEDLRKLAFFTIRPEGWVNYTGNYSGGNRIFAGLTTSEMMLVNAECKARLEDLSGASEKVNGLLRKRFLNSEFQEIIYTDKDQALLSILDERRKELFGRGIRWSDLKRLNRDSQLAVTIERKIGNEVYILPPNDQRYKIPIPPREVNLDNL